jgi:hypothetical protein
MQGCWHDTKVTFTAEKLLSVNPFEQLARI